MNNRQYFFDTVACAYQHKAINACYDLKINPYDTNIMSENYGEPMWVSIAIKMAELDIMIRHLKVA